MDQIRDFLQKLQISYIVKGKWVSNFNGSLSISDKKLGEMMKKNLMLKGFFALLFIFAVQASVQAAPACKGPNKNDAGCAEELPAEPDPVVAVVDSVTVDWLNEKLTVRGSGFAGSTNFLLGSSVTPLVTTVISPTEVDIAFSAVMAAEVMSQGNYNLVVDGGVQLSVYVESQVIDPADDLCPCETDLAWSTELGGLWGPQNTECLEIVGLLTNDPADIAGTVLSDPPDGTSYPIGASFYPGDPDNSTCRLVQVDGDESVVELVNRRINETQQEDCALLLQNNICTPPPPP